jgi:hypothetical protein
MNYANQEVNFFAEETGILLCILKKWMNRTKEE